MVITSSPFMQNVVGTALPHEITGLNLTVLKADTPPVHLAFARVAPTDIEPTDAVVRAPETTLPQTLNAPVATPRVRPAPLRRIPKTDRN